jgi:Arc/MetJ-type ribon-helix-helix transcriptional regulator
MIRLRNVFEDMNDRLPEIDKSHGITYSNTTEFDLPKAKIAISIDEKVLERVDGLVRDGVFGNRSQAIEAAVADKLARLGRTRLAMECAKLDQAAERDLAEEGLSEEISGWPEY